MLLDSCQSILGSLKRGNILVPTDKISTEVLGLGLDNTGKNRRGSQSTPDDQISNGNLVTHNVRAEGQVLVELLVGGVERLEVRGGQLGFSKIQPLIDQGRADGILGVVETSLRVESGQKSSNGVGGFIGLTTRRVTCQHSIHMSLITYTYPL